MAFIKVGSLSSLPPDSVTEVMIGDDAYAICNQGGQLHALWGICPHAGGAIGQGALQENSILCPWHEWAYNCQNRENDYDPAGKLRKFATTVEGADIHVVPHNPG